MNNLKDKITDKNFKEGEVTKEIESLTAQIPSNVFLCAALTVLAGAAVLKCLGKKHTALLVGQWASPFLLFGIYDKIVKTQGHDESEPKQHQIGE